jgi:uncharacterized membrane protein/glutaredoxin
MSTRAERRRTARTGHVLPEATPPALSTVALSVAGLLVSAYLSWTKITGAQALFCTAASSCDVVQASRYATLLGVPTGLWGLALYAVIGILALQGFTFRRWRAALVVATAATAFSVYLTAVSLFVLHAACPYCLVSLAIEVAILVDVARRWRAVPGARSGLPAPRLLALAGATAAVTVVAALGVFAVSPEGATSYQIALARHLTATKATMYGAYWCPHCVEQKELFSSASSMVPYVECDPKGAGARPDLCERASVKSFPTWVIGDQRLEGTQSLDALARASRFPG